VSLEGRDLEAMRLYEEAVRSALDKGFIQEAALGAELAADFFARRGFDRIAQSYRREARDNYRRWGALAKGRPARPAPSRSRTTGYPRTSADRRSVARTP
jgi:hypothetical protein